MKQTFYQLYDFLDFDPEGPGKEHLWKAGSPTSAKPDGSDIVFSVPFNRLLPGRDTQIDPGSLPQEYQLHLRAYGNSILRIGIGFGSDVFKDSEMLEIHPELKIEPLEIQLSEDCWEVRDSGRAIRARLNRRQADTDHWSDLLPPPDLSLELDFYPDGRKATGMSAFDQFFPARQEAFPIAYVENANQCHRSTLSFHAEPDEIFCGTGERFSKLDLSGRTFELRNMDGQGVNNRRTYKNIPFFISSRMTGFFMHTSAFGKISLADHSTRSVQLMAEDDNLDVFLIGGSSPDEILFRYRQLTGFPSMPPVWSFGTWMSRMTYFSADEVREICDRLREEEYPADVIHLDTGWFTTDWLCEWTFNKERFPDPPGFIGELMEKGFRVSLWQMPYIAEDAIQLDEALKNDFIGKRSQDSLQGDSNFSALDYAGSIDFTSPTAVEWYKGLLKNLLDMGVACIKTDFGEDIHMDAEYKGMDAEKLRNLYALLYQKAAFDITRKITGDGIVWARAGWAGCQRYPVHWGGDAASTWDGMAGSLKGGLHMGLSGFGFWSHDVPGFHGLPDFMNAVIPDDLYVRWTQFGVFTSHLRYHGTSKREPWHFPEVSDIVRKWLRLRYALLPYLIAQSEKVTRTGFPFIRALIFHHPEDRLCWHIHDQYYFGDDFLVAPVMNSRNQRDVYLPEGNWINFFSGENMGGGQWLKDLSIPLEEMPVYVRKGASIPVYPEKILCTNEYVPKKMKYIEFDKTYRGIAHSCLGDLLGEQ